MQIEREKENGERYSKIVEYLNFITYFGYIKRHKHENKDRQTKELQSRSANNKVIWH